MIDRAALDRKVHDINVLLEADAGRIEVVDLPADGVVVIRFGGMCTNCPCKPLTTMSTVSPMLREVEGVRSVSVIGARISTEAQQSIVQAAQRAAVAAAAHKEPR